MNRDGADAESPFPWFFSFSALFKNSSLGKRSENCLRFGTGGPSLFLYLLLSRNILFFPALTTCIIGILSTLTYTEFDCAALLAML